MYAFVFVYNQCFFVNIVINYNAYKQTDRHTNPCTDTTIDRQTELHTRMMHTHTTEDNRAICLLYIIVLCLLHVLLYCAYYCLLSVLGTAENHAVFCSTTI